MYTRTFSDVIRKGLASSSESFKFPVLIGFFPVTKSEEFPVLVGFSRPVGAGNGV